MSFDGLHLDIYQLVFDYLPQEDLLNLLSIKSKSIVDQLIKYLRAELSMIETFEDVKDCCKWNMIISIICRIPKTFNWNDMLIVACKCGHKVFAELSCEMGADNWNGGLMYACIGDHKDIAKLMIEKGANDFNSPLHQACRLGHIDCVELMINKGASFCFACGNKHKYIT